MHICVSKLTIIGLDNGLSPDWRQAIIWINAGILLIGPVGTNFSEILIEIQIFSFKKMYLKMLFTKWRPFVSASMWYASYGTQVVFIVLVQSHKLFRLDNFSQYVWQGGEIWSWWLPSAHTFVNFCIFQKKKKKIFLPVFWRLLMAFSNALETFSIQ